MRTIAQKFFLAAIPVILLACTSQKMGSEKTITFRVVPKSLPLSSKIYLTGNHSKLGDWQPNVAVLHQQSDGSWSRSFSFRKGTLLEFKMTRGNWESEVVGAQGLEFPNYVLQVERDTTLIIEIGSWRDTLKRATFLSEGI